jgi:hypothetical protein
MCLISINVECVVHVKYIVSMINGVFMTIDDTIHYTLTCFCDDVARSNNPRLLSIEHRLIRGLYDV